MKRIVIATDGSSDAARAVADGLKLAGELEASVTFVCARTAPNALLGEPFYQRELDAEVAHARDVIGAVMKQAVAASVKADYEILDGAPADAILRVAETHDADLLVVGSRGLGAMQSAGTRSRNSRGGTGPQQQGPGPVSKALVTRSKRPVLVVKSSGDEPQRDVPLVDHGSVLSR